MLRNKENRSGVLAGAILKSGNREMLLPEWSFFPVKHVSYPLMIFLLFEILTERFPDKCGWKGHLFCFLEIGERRQMDWRRSANGSDKSKSDKKKKKRVRSSSKQFQMFLRKTPFLLPIRQEFQGILAVFGTILSCLLKKMEKKPCILFRIVSLPSSRSFADRRRTRCHCARRRNGIFC